METVWLQRLHVLLEIGKRCVHLAGCIALPTGAWVVQQARQLAWLLQDRKIQARFLLRDRDSKFTAGFDEVFRREGVEVIRVPYRSPRANSFAETSGGDSTGRDPRPPTGIFSRGHLERILVEFIEHYHRARPHQGLDQRSPGSLPELRHVPSGDVVCRDRLGGLIHEYSRAA